MKDVASSILCGDSVVARKNSQPFYNVVITSSRLSSINSVETQRSTTSGTGSTYMMKTEKSENRQLGNQKLRSLKYGALFSTI